MSEEFKTAVERLAEQDMCSVSDVFRQAIVPHLRDRGLLKAPAHPEN
jgi:hypothetical protein